MAKIVDTIGNTLYEDISSDIFGTLQDAIAEEIDLDLVDLSGETLHGIDLDFANLIGACLEETSLHNASLNYVDLKGANLFRADLSGASLRRASLRGANLNGANLSGADLRGVDLRGASLEHADMSGANLKGANLRLARLRYHDKFMPEGGAVRACQTVVNLPGVINYHVELIHDQRSWAGGPVWGNLAVLVKEDRE